MSPNVKFSLICFNFQFFSSIPFAVQTGISEVFLFFFFLSLFFALTLIWPVYISFKLNFRVCSYYVWWYWGEHIFLTSIYGFLSTQNPAVHMLWTTQKIPCPGPVNLMNNPLSSPVLSNNKSPLCIMSLWAQYDAAVLENISHFSSVTDYPP